MGRNVKRHLGDYHRYLVESLRDPEEAMAYLDAALEEDDPEDFLVALRNVVEAHGISRTARMTGFNRVTFYKMLSKRGNPSISSLYTLLKALGLRFRVDKAGKKAA